MLPVIKVQRVTQHKAQTRVPTNLLRKQLAVGVQGGVQLCLPSNHGGHTFNTFVSVSSLMRDEGAGNVHWSSFIAAAVVTVTRYTSSPIGWTHSLFTVMSLFLSSFFLFFLFFISYITCTLKISTWFLIFFTQVFLFPLFLHFSLKSSYS